MGDRRHEPTLANLAAWALGSFFLTAALLQGCIPDPPTTDLNVEITP